MHPEALVIVVIFVFCYPFFDHNEHHPVIYLGQLVLIVLGYLYYLKKSLYKLRRTSPVHEFQDEEEQVLISHKSE